MLYIWAELLLMMWCQCCVCGGGVSVVFVDVLSVFWLLMWCQCCVCGGGVSVLVVDVVSVSWLWKCTL